MLRFRSRWQAVARGAARALVSRLARYALAAAAGLPAVGCAPSTPDGRPRDDAGDPLPAGTAYRRIVSLNPATTELFFALGAGDRLVGRTQWDAWPEAARQVPDLGDGIRPSVEAVLGARPDLVVLYATGDNRDAARALRDAGIDVMAIRTDRIADFERVAATLGEVVGRTGAARVVVDSVRGTLDRVRRATADRPRPTVFMLAWENPLMTIGAGSFLSELIEIAGGRNVFGDLPAPSPQVTFEEVLRRDPDVILGGPGMLERLHEHPRWRLVPAVRDRRVLVMDTALVGRPGIRLGEAAVSIARLLHPGSMP